MTHIIPLTPHQSGQRRCILCGTLENSKTANQHCPRKVTSENPRRPRDMHPTTRRNDTRREPRRMPDVQLESMLEGIE